MATPVRSVHLDSVASTMEEAKSRFDGAPLLVTADRQTRGRGRSGREWVHADRAVAASLAVDLRWAPDDRGVVPLIAGVGAAGTFRVSLKWPNDLVRDGAKVGGILVEAADDLTVVGLGVNLFWPRPIDGAAALFVEDPGAAAATDLAERWAGDVLRRLGGGPGAWDRDEYMRLCTTIGREVTWDGGGPGTARGVDGQGRLVVETPSGIALLDSGEVTHVRAQP